VLQEALALHQKGELEQARALYEKLLQLEPANSDALHLLGVVLHQTGDSAAGARLIEHAIRLSPKQGAFYNNLGEALRGCQRWQDAARAYNKAVEINPQMAGAWYWLGVCLWQMNELNAALQALSNALILKPEQTHWRMGLAQIYKAMQKWQEAEREYRTVLTHTPTHHDALLNLGDVLIKAGQPEAAADVLAHLVGLQPNWALGWCNYALALQQQGRLDEAEFAIEKTKALAPDYALGYLNAAVIAQYRGDYTQAERATLQALALDSHLHEARFNLANYQLLRNDAEGWQNFSARWQLPSMKAPNFAEYHHCPAPEWQGEALAGKHILVFPEQGIGDALQFLRYLGALCAHAGKVSAGVVAPLQRLVRQFELDVEWIDDVQALPGADFKVAMLSLPALLQPSMGNELPAQLSLKTLAVPAWRERAARLDANRKKIGLVWSGSLQQPVNRFRRIPVEKLVKLADANRRSQFVLLQKGVPEEEVEQVGQALDAVDWSVELNDFFDTAAALEHLDGVICVDTSVAHLAGVMGKTGWVCLSPAADWRWRGGTHSVFYPSLRLLRQSELNEWDSVIEALLAQLNPA